MRMPHKKYLIGAAVLALLGAGVAEAATAQLHTMKVAQPDGSVVNIAYTGDVAPKVQIVPARTTAANDDEMDPFARMDQISAMMDAQMHAMMQRAALLQQQAAQMQQHAVLASDAAPGTPGMTAVSDVPKGAHVSYYSSSTDANGCTRSTSYTSDGSGAAPKLTQAASDGCDAAKPSAQATPAKIEQPVEKAPAPGQKV